ncbi:CobE protein [Granulibacter bethesdensis]|uniref:CobE protein n=1 Tax=Granulibacter bethesdensis TaxID=364410 RepID=A0AAC9K6H8_9PROT|nr:cobalamin biosynthesis protein [Granulibacter bethesdensis]APH53911.1 CobE protein [Granulibacter bethesdensis]APH61489.1 CobE protein [Granulibacter bethesdensis]
MSEGRRVVAGLGCRPLCAAEAVIALLYQAAQTAPFSMVAIPEFRTGADGLMEALTRLGYPVQVISMAALQDVQHRCVTRSAAALRTTGLASVAEAAALAAAGPLAHLILPRIAADGVSCALAAASATEGMA